MNYYIIVRNNGSYKVNWAKFFSPEDHKLILIADKVSYKRMCENGNIKYIDTFITTDLFETENLITLVDGVIAKYQLKDKLDACRIATIGEIDLLPCAQMREHYGIVGDRVEDVDVFRDKYLMKQKLQSLKQHLPNHTKFNKAQFKQSPSDYLDTVIAQVGLPIFVKPTLNSGSIGTKKINSKEELQAWAESITDDTVYEIDQFLTGELYHCDSIIINGEIKHAFVSRYLYPNAESLQGKTLGSITLDPSSEYYEKIIEFNKNVLACFKPLQSCCTHLEFFITPDKQIKFVEIAKRPPGALVPELYHHQFGIDLREIDYKLQLGLPVEIQIKPGKFTGWCYFMNRAGFLQQQNQPKHFTSEYSITWEYDEGTLLKAPTELADYAATMLFHNSDYSKLVQDFESLRGFQGYELLPLNIKKNQQHESGQIKQEIQDIRSEIKIIIEGLKNVQRELSLTKAPVMHEQNNDCKVNRQSFF